MGSLQTVLGEWGNPHEVFRVDECATLPIEAVVEFDIVVRDASVWSERSRTVTLPLLKRVAERLEKERAAPRAAEGAVKAATQRRQQRDETGNAEGTTTVDVVDDTGLVAPPVPGPSARVSTDDADADAAGAGAVPRAEAGAGASTAGSGVAAAFSIGPRLLDPVDESRSLWQRLGGRAPLGASLSTTMFWPSTNASSTPCCAGDESRT
jgi:hypothetical protein